MGQPAQGSAAGDIHGHGCAFAIHIQAKLLLYTAVGKPGQGKKLPAGWRIIQKARFPVYPVGGRKTAQHENVGLDFFAGTVDNEPFLQADLARFPDFLLQDAYHPLDIVHSRKFALTGNSLKKSVFTVMQGGLRILFDQPGNILGINPDKSNHFTENAIHFSQLHGQLFFLCQKPV